MPVALALLAESRGPSRRLDICGVALASSGLLGVVFGIVRAQELGWTSVGVLASIGGGIVLLGAFVAWELRAPAPMLPMRFFRNRAFAATNRLAGDVLRDLRLDLPAGPVLPGRAGLLTARGRAPHAPVDGHADLRGPGRRHPVRPDRQPAADGGRAGASGARARLPRHHERSGRRLRHARARVRHGRHRDGARVRPGRQRRAQLGATERGGPGLGRYEHDPRGRRRAGRRGARHRLHRGGRLRLAPGTTWTV